MAALTRILSKSSALIALFAFAPNIVFGQVVITEIMYNVANGSDAGHEWIEVYNNSTDPLKLTSWRLNEDDKNHKITSVAGGDTLMPGTYAVIADNANYFKSDVPDYAGQLFDSAFSLSNTGETISIQDASSTHADVVSYESDWGANGDGNSLNRSPGSSGDFTAHAPSPGKAMSSSVIPPKVKDVPPPKAPKAKAARKTSSRTSTSKSLAAQMPDLSDASSSDTDYSQTAAAAEAGGSNTLWYAAAAALALVAALGVFAARRVSSKEWNIVDESE